MAWNTATTTAWSFDHEKEDFDEYSDQELAVLLYGSFMTHVQEVTRNYVRDPRSVVELLFDPFDTFEWEAPLCDRQ